MGQILVAAVKWLRWIVELKREGRSPNTVDGYERVYARHMKPRSTTFRRRCWSSSQPALRMCAAGPEKVDRFVETMDREPTPRERWQLERQAAIDSRPAKAHSVDAEVLHDGWRAEQKLP